VRPSRLPSLALWRIPPSGLVIDLYSQRTLHSSPLTSRRSCYFKFALINNCPSDNLQAKNSGPLAQTDRVDRPSPDRRPHGSIWCARMLPSSQSVVLTATATVGVAGIISPDFFPSFPFIKLRQVYFFFLRHFCGFFLEEERDVVIGRLPWERIMDAEENSHVRASEPCGEL
jgi:hypothetical protein